MKRVLLLTGPIGCGKSTLIKNALGGAAKRAGGFVTVRARDESGALAGFELLRACSVACEDRHCEAYRFLSFGAGGARREDSVFRVHAVRMLEKAGEAPFALLDETGGFELMIPEFRSALYAFMNSGVPCVGVLKSLPAAGELRERAGLPEGYLALASQLRDTLLSSDDALLLETTGRYDSQAERMLAEWTEEYARERE